MGIALMYCFALLITAKSYFYEGAMAKRLSASQLLIQHMPFYTVSGKGGLFIYTVTWRPSISITYSGCNSLAKLDNKAITGSHIPVLSQACHLEICLRHIRSDWTAA